MVDRCSMRFNHCGFCLRRVQGMRVCLWPDWLGENLHDGRAKDRQVCDGQISKYQHLRHVDISSVRFPLLAWMPINHHRNQPHVTFPLCRSHLPPRGVNFRALAELFALSSQDEGKEFQFRVSMLEVRNTSLQEEQASAFEVYADCL